VLKRLLLVGCLAAALGLGAVGPACAECCPAGGAAASVAAAQACCGDCAPTVERSSGPAMIAKADLPDAPVFAILAPTSASAVSIDRCAAGIGPAGLLARTHPASPPRPLRL
jgi:hypothetical protein